MSYFCNYFAASFMTTTLQKIENKHKREWNPGDEESVAVVVRASAGPIVFEMDGPEKE
jgi:hypothetical protein